MRATCRVGRLLVGPHCRPRYTWQPLSSSAGGSSADGDGDEMAVRKVQLLQIARARQNRDAPVDIMGCGSVADSRLLDPACDETDADKAYVSSYRPIVRRLYPFDRYRFESLVAGILSAQNRDEVTAFAVQKLRDEGD